MVTWKGLAWIALAGLVCLGTTLGWAAAPPPPKDPTCAARCVAAEAYCTLAFQVSEEQGDAHCITNTVAHGGCSELLAAAGTACPQHVTDAQTCIQAVGAAATCLHTCAAKLAKRRECACL